MYHIHHWNHPCDVTDVCLDGDTDDPSGPGRIAQSLANRGVNRVKKKQCAFCSPSNVRRAHCRFESLLSVDIDAQTKV